MNNLKRVSIVILLNLLVLGLLPLFKKGYKTLEHISYSEFKILAKNKLVDKLVIKRTTITEDFLPGTVATLQKIRKIQVKPIEKFKIYRINDPELLKILDEAGIHYQIKPEISHWVTLFSWLLPVLIFVAFWLIIFEKFTGGESGIWSFGKSKAKIYIEDERKVTFKDVAGVPEAVEELKKITEFLKNPEKFVKIGAKILKGVLVVGPPGTEKLFL